MATNLQFIQQLSSNGKVTNFDLQNIFGKGYKQYNIFLKVNDTSGDGYIGLRFIDASDAVITGSEYDLAGIEFKSNTSFDNSWRDVSTTQIAPIMTGGNPSTGGGALVRIFNADDSSSFTFVTAQSSMTNSSNLRGTKTIGVHKNAEQITGVRFAGVSHTYDTTATIYGVK
tara:strand:+ start:1056 stop:1568 length:513 start_codon:yes stop_codon:yes gene_type:complete